jgi:Flp pilus assembly secretin CpaC
MRKRPLCLALSMSIAILQANLLQAGATPASPAIWQQLSGASAQGQASGKRAAKKAPHAVHAVAVKKTPTAAACTANDVAVSAMNGQVVLFLGKGKDADSAGNQAPAAALTIHTALPETVAAEELAAQPTLVALNSAPETRPSAAESTEPSVVPVSTASTHEETASLPLTSSKDLLAQLAPDQIIAQASDQPVNATPIPPVVSGTVDLEEFKPTNSIDLKVSQSRTFKLRNKVIRTSISDPSIAEPVVVAENQLVLLGKAPCNSLAIDVHVNHDFSTLQAMLREVDPRIIVRPFAVGGTDRLILTGDVDHPESIVRAFAIADAFMDDRGMNITVAANRILGARLGEQGGVAQTGGSAGQLSTIGSSDRYTFFGNQNNNISKAQTMVSDGNRVTSLVRVRKTPLIVLHCTFLEMNSQAAREIGAQLGLSFQNQNFSFAIGGNNGSATTGNVLTSALGGLTGNIAGANNLQANVVPNIFNAITGVTTAAGTSTLTTTPTGLGAAIPATAPSLLALSNLFGIPGGASFSNAGLQNLFTSLSTITTGKQGTWTINPTVQAVISHSRARVLAEPTLVTISGERAAFLVGGEVPILSSIATAGTAAQSVTFEPFGLRLNMIPVLEENGAINLQVAPEERLLNASIGFNVPGSTSIVPGFTTRRTQTTVEMRPGQELFIAGLVSANHGRELDKIPVIGEIPVIGALYRSKAFAKNESELVVAVRPEIILPGTPGQLKLPEEISKVEGPRDTNMFQVEPTVLDERYWRSGRAEKTLQLPGVLPPDAPIPDNK